MLKIEERCLNATKLLQDLKEKIGDKEVASAAIEEIISLRMALTKIAGECIRCRGEQSYRDTNRFVYKTAMDALGERGPERSKS